MSQSRIQSALRGARLGAIIGFSSGGKWGNSWVGYACVGIGTGLLFGTGGSLVVTLIAVTGYSVVKLFDDNTFNKSDEIIRAACSKYWDTGFLCNFSRSNLIRDASCYCTVLGTGKAATELNRQIRDQTQEAYQSQVSRDRSMRNQNIRDFATDFTLYGLFFGATSGLVICGIAGGITGYRRSRNSNQTADVENPTESYIEYTQLTEPVTRNPATMYSPRQKETLDKALEPALQNSIRK